MKREPWVEVSLYGSDDEVIKVFIGAANQLEREHSRWHVFWGEPYAAGCVVRIEEQHKDAVVEIVNNHRKWADGKWQGTVRCDVAPYEHDEEAWREFYEPVLDFFHANSVLACRVLATSSQPSILTDRKLVHCMLNALGYKRADEAHAYRVMAATAELYSVIQREGDEPRGVFAHGRFSIPRFEP